MAEQSTGSVTSALLVVAAVSILFALSGLSFALLYPNASLLTMLARFVYSLGVFGTTPLLLWYSYRTSESLTRAEIRRRATSDEDDNPHSASETAELTELAKGGPPAGYLSTLKVVIGLAITTSVATLIGLRVPLDLPVIGPVSLGWYLFPPLGLVGYFLYHLLFDMLGELLYRVVS